MSNNAEDIPDLIPARMLDEFAYCPRLAYIEWVQGEFRENKHTLEGTRRHVSVDVEKGHLPDPEEIFGHFRARSVSMSSNTAGLITIMDILEGKNGQVHPVEIKKGKGPDDGAWFADRVQMGAQMMVARDNGYNCPYGFIYYSATNRKEKVELDCELIDTVIDMVKEFRKVARSGNIPSPLVDSPKCNGCSIAGICLPDETLLSQGIELDVERIRLLYPARDDTSPMFVMEQGAYVGKSGEEVAVKKKGESLGKVRLMDVSSVNLYGNVQISTQMVSELLDQGIPVCFFSYGGWFRGIAHGMVHKNVELRIRQYAIQADRSRSMQLASAFITAKIRNSRTILMRNSETASTEGLDEMKRLAQKASECREPESLLGIEGAAARSYFANFATMLRVEELDEFDFNGRNRRPPRDPVNALLSYVYSMLVKDLAVTSLAVGFDPMLGFFHRPRYGRPALALDLMEEFRPIIADSVVISVINNGEVKPTDFISRGNAVAMGKDAKHSVIKAYERRMNTLVTHPVFGYQVSYRRNLELQCRLLARYLMGEISEYKGFTTR